MSAKKPPVSFDSWLGKIVDDEAAAHGGRPAIQRWTGLSEASVNRRSRGQVPYTVGEIEVIADSIGVRSAELVERALARYGGIEKLLAEYVSEPPISLADERAARTREVDPDRLEDAPGSRAANVDDEYERDEPDPT